MSSAGSPFGIDWGLCFPAEAMIAGTAPIMHVSASCPRDLCPQPLEYVDPAAVSVLIYLGVQTLFPQSVEFRNS